MLFEPILRASRAVGIDAPMASMRASIRRLDAHIEGSRDLAHLKAPDLLGELEDLQMRILVVLHEKFIRGAR